MINVMCARSCDVRKISENEKLKTRENRNDGIEEMFF